MKKQIFSEEEAKKASCDYFGGDELALSQMHNLNEGTISIITAIIATIVCSYVIFVILPKKYLISFFAASLIGGISGYYLWFCKLGPYVLPAIQWEEIAWYKCIWSITQWLK